MYDVPSETTKFVDDLVVPRAFRREETAIEASFMYSLGVLRAGWPERPQRRVLLPTRYLVVNSEFRSAKTMIPCASKQRARVNTHRERQRLLGPNFSPNFRCIGV